MVTPSRRTSKNRLVIQPPPQRIPFFSNTFHGARKLLFVNSWPGSSSAVLCVIIPAHQQLACWTFGIFPLHYFQLLLSARLLHESVSLFSLCFKNGRGVMAIDFSHNRREVSKVFTNKCPSIVRRAKKNLPKCHHKPVQRARVDLETAHRFQHETRSMGINPKVVKFWSSTLKATGSKKPNSVVWMVVPWVQQNDNFYDRFKFAQRP